MKFSAFLLTTLVTMGYVFAPSSADSGIAGSSLVGRNDESTMMQQKSTNSFLTRLLSALPFNNGSTPNAGHGGDAPQPYRSLRSSSSVSPRSNKPEIARNDGMGHNVMAYSDQNVGRTARRLPVGASQFSFASDVHDICDKIDNCNPGTFEGKKWYCGSRSGRNTRVPGFCLSGWEECQQYANPIKFEGEFWVCPGNRNTATGNRCESGWMRFSDWEEYVADPDNCPQED